MLLFILNGRKRVRNSSPSGIGAEMESLKKIMTELKIEDNNDPNGPEKPLRYTSFAGRVRVAALVQKDSING